jgi:hypothetical protein
MGFSHSYGLDNKSTVVLYLECAGREPFRLSFRVGDYTTTGAESVNTCALLAGNRRGHDLALRSRAGQRHFCEKGVFRTWKRQDWLALGDWWNPDEKFGSNESSGAYNFLGQQVRKGIPVYFTGSVGRVQTSGQTIRENYFREAAFMDVCSIFFAGGSRSG